MISRMTVDSSELVVCCSWRVVQQFSRQTLRAGTRELGSTPSSPLWLSALGVPQVTPTSAAPEPLSGVLLEGAPTTPLIGHAYRYDSCEHDCSDDSDHRWALPFVLSDVGVRSGL